jgi:hypothetical protein
MIANSAIKRLPAMVISGKFVEIPRQIALPKPPAPMKEAMPPKAMVMTTIVRNPLKIMGRAKGNLMIQSNCQPDVPMPIAASRISGFTSFKPVYVFLTMGSSPYNTMAITALFSPIPEMETRIPNSAMDGMV